MSTKSFYEFHEKYGFWGKKNFSSYINFEQINNKKINISHNKFGTREKNFTIEKTKKRVLCFGGSHTWGAAVNQEKRYSDILNSQNIEEFLNFGQCSFGIDQILIYLKNEMMKFKPDTIIIEQYPWALLRVINNYVNGYVRPFFYIDDNGGVREKKLSNILKISIFRNIFGNYLSFKKEYNEYISDIEFNYNFIDPIFKLWNQNFYKDMYKISQFIFNEIKNICKVNDINLLIVVNSVKEELFYESKSLLIDYNIPRLKLLEILDYLELNYVDVSNEMKNFHKNTDVMYSDGHINEIGNQIIAKNIRDRL